MAAGGCLRTLARNSTACAHRGAARSRPGTRQALISLAIAKRANLAATAASRYAIRRRTAYSLRTRRRLCIRSSSSCVSATRDMNVCRRDARIGLARVRDQNMEEHRWIAKDERIGAITCRANNHRAFSRTTRAHAAATLPSQLFLCHRYAGGSSYRYVLFYISVTRHPAGRGMLRCSR